MSHPYRNMVLTLSVVVLSALRLAGQEDSGWRISPEKINIQLGEDRTLQVLDDSAQELRGATWSVDDANLADLSEDDGREVLHAKAAGSVTVTAILAGQVRSRTIKIWPELQPLPEGTTRWATHSIGQDIKDIPAVPTYEDGPNLYSLEQTRSGSTYLRAFSEDGTQLWSWLMPEGTRTVEFICGDWFGGAEISANHSDSFTLYAVGKDGNLRWQDAVPGVRKGLAISTDHYVYLLSQSVDGRAATFTALDEFSGSEKFKLPLPPSVETQVGVETQGTTVSCSSSKVSNPSRIVTSGVYVNMDGYPYVAFTQRARSLTATKCAPGSAADSGKIYLERDEKLILWQIHQDGTYRSTIVEEIKNTQPPSAAIYTLAPTSGIITDNMNGTLIPTKWSDDLGSGTVNDAADDVVYRVDKDGTVVYKLPLPRYTGPLNDGMVIGSNELAFATRGGILVAFNVTTGKDLWHWDSNTPEISVLAALANGDCLVQTPTALVEVTSSTESKELFKGKAMIDWRGHMYLQNN